MEQRNDRAEPLNRVLGILSAEDCARIETHLERVELPYRQPLYEANKAIEHVYFLEAGVASLVKTMRNGAASEVGTIGNEGIVGLPVVLGDTRGPTSVYMQVPGHGLKMKASLLLAEIERSDTLKAFLLRYAHAFFNQVALSAACSHHHTLNQRCCRWLLMTYDRMQSDSFLLTQEFLAMMLGVQRPTVSLAAAKLQKSGLIKYHRGTIEVLDRDGLESRSCECYEVVRTEFERLLCDWMTPRGKR